MATRPSLGRLTDFQIKLHGRAVDQIQAMIADIERLIQNLNREILVEEDRTGLHDPAYFAYPTFAKATIQRRDNLRRSADRLKIQLDAANKALSEAMEQSEANTLADDAPFHVMEAGGRRL
jgi:hypothetical protein